MAKGKKEKNEVSFLGFDPVETPDEIINSDTNNDRKEAFKEAYKKVMQIIPDYFISQKKRKKNSGSTGGFSQSIVITPNDVKIETTEMQKQEQEKQTEKEEKERE